jgi:hypothetical protein
MKTKKTLAILAALAFSGGSMAQDKTADIEAIKSMCGCYAITFDYAETFSPDTNYQLKDSYHAKADAEWVFVEEESEDKLVLQHLLVIGDTMVIKHWRQDWIYENRDFHHFDKNKTWNYVTARPESVEGQWTQKVYQVDDSPRYEGSASWVHVDGRHYWESTTDAPLPRREFTKRSDYDVMKRRNRHEITDYGWVHEQDNEKLVREEGADRLIAEEKGWNKYTKVDEAKCQAAKDWWEENKAYWALVRAEWDAVFAQKETLSLASTVNDQKLFQALFALGDEARESNQKDPESLRKAIAETISDFQSAAATTGMTE